MKKIINALSLCLVLILCALIPLNAYAITGATIADFSNTSLDDKDEYNFNENIANDPSFLNLVIGAAQKKGKNISLEDVHPVSNIKLYGLAGSENVLQTFYNSYKESKAIKDLISPDYSVLVLYFNKNNEYVDSLVFTRKENLPNAQDKNGWVMLSSGSMIIKDNFITEYSEYDNLKNYVENLGLKNAKELKFVSGIPNMPVSIYFIQNDVEFIIPLENYANMNGSQVYKVSDIFDKYLEPVLEYQNEKIEEYSNLDPKDIPLGASPIPDNLPSITSVDLHTYFEADTNYEKGNDILKIVIICSSVVALIAICYGVIAYTRKGKANNKA